MFWRKHRDEENEADIASMRMQDELANGEEPTRKEKHTVTYLESKNLCCSWQLAIAPERVKLENMPTNEGKQTSFASLRHFAPKFEVITFRN